VLLVTRLLGHCGSKKLRLQSLSPRLSKLFNWINTLIYGSSLIHIQGVTIQKLKAVPFFISRGRRFFGYPLPKNWVQNQVEKIVNHLWEQFLDVGIRNTKVWVRIDFDEPHSEIFIDKEIETEKLKTVLSLVRVQSLPGRLIHVQHKILDSLQKVLLKIQLVLRKCLIQILLKSFEAYCVSILVLPVVITIFLQTVVSQVHIVVLVVEGVVVRASPQISLIVTVKLILVRCESPHSYVELSSLKEQRLLNVLLHDPVGI